MAKSTFCDVPKSFNKVCTLLSGVLEKSELFNKSSWLLWLLLTELQDEYCCPDVRNWLPSKFSALLSKEVKDSSLVADLTDFTSELGTDSCLHGLRLFSDGSPESEYGNKQVI